MTQTPTDALRLVPNMPTVELTDDMLFKIETGETVTWGELKRRQYEQAVRNFNTMREDGPLPAPASPLPGGGTSYAAGGLDVLSRIRSRLNEQIDRAEADLNSTVTIRLNDAKAIRHMLAPSAPTGDA